VTESIHDWILVHDIVIYLDDGTTTTRDEHIPRRSGPGGSFRSLLV